MMMRPDLQRAASAPPGWVSCRSGQGAYTRTLSAWEPNAESPFRSKLADVSRRLEDEAGLFRIASLVDPRRGSHSLLLGARWISPGCAPVEWTADADTHEAYYVLSGTVRVTWRGEAPGEAMLGREDALFLAPDRTYTVENAGAEEVCLLYAMTPPPEHERVPEPAAQHDALRDSL